MLQVNNICYSYDGKKNVLDNLSLTFKEGGVYGLLGENGTGKSTLLYCIMGLLRPQQGEILMDGNNVTDRKPETMSEMFIVPEEYDMPATTLSRYIKVIKPFYPNFNEALAKELLEIFEMPSDIDLSSLSMGMKKKVYICLALAAQTKVLLMDEPTNGLDIPSKANFRKVIARGMREDQIIVISTHQVKDIEKLLDHVTIIDRQRVLKNEAINIDEPLDLEKLFIETIKG